MDIATWNVNSIRTRLDRLLAWLSRHQPDVVCLQELKVADADFPLEAMRKAGYHSAVHGQPTYNGVAVLAKLAFEDVRVGLADGIEDPQARLISVSAGGVRVLSVYVPNGQEVGSDKWAYKLEFLGRLRDYLARHHDPAEPLALCGDFNIAPDDDDVARPAAWAGSVLCHEAARSELARLTGWGLVDAVRRCHPAGGVFTWWDYRNLGFPRDDGLRLDHVLVTPPLAERLAGARVDRDERKGEKPSDHAPVIVSLADISASAGASATAGALVSADVSTTVTAPTDESTPGTGDELSGAASGRDRPLVVLVDGHSVAYRAFYGLPLYDRSGRPSFSTSSGELTNAVYGFANMLVKTWNEEQPDYLAVAFDLGRTFRDDLFAEYKATREKMPDELSPQIGRIVQLVEAFGIPALTADGFEADDILGTLAQRAERDGLDVLIVTGDTDTFQLITEHVRVLSPGRLWSDTAIHDRAAVVARYGLEPAQLIDFKALKGDASDNVPGVKGIGEKSAQPLVARYGTVEEIYRHLDEVEPERVRKALAADAEMALLSKTLVTIRTDAPVVVDWRDCAVHAYDRSRVEALFDELEFRSIRNRLPQGGTATAGAAQAPRGGRAAEPSDREPRESASAETPGAPTTEADAEPVPPREPGAAAPEGPPAVARSMVGAGEQMSLFGSDAGAGVRPARPAPRPSVTATTVVADRSGLDALEADLASADVIAVDVEATATDPLRAELVGVALATREGAGYYVPVGHGGTERQLPWDVVRDAIRPALEDPLRPKVAHNAKYDMAVLRLAGIELSGLVADTMLAEFVLEPGSRLGLKILSRAHLGVEMTEIAELIGTGKHQITMAQVSIDEAAPYAAADVDMTLRLMRQQAPRLDASGMRKLLDDVEMPLVPVLLDMELAGVLIDAELLAVLSDRLNARLHQIESDVFRMVNVPFNLSSPQQLADVLFKQLGLKAPGARTTSTGRASVAADVLESMQGQHPVIDLVLEHRQLSKIKGTYVDALPLLVNPRTGRVHTSFNQTGAVSGRLSSQDPNLQNIPIRTDLGKEVRQAFIVPPGCRMISADYSQVELRIVAHLSDDPGLKAAFAAGEDVHRATAARVLGLEPEDVTADQRSFAKRINFGLLYGMGARSLAQQAGIPMTEAQQFVDAYFAAFPQVKGYIEETKRRAKEDGYVETLLGRRRYFPILQTVTRDARTNVLQRAAEREAINHPMQGSAADIIKIAMTRIHTSLGKRGCRARMLLQVHDELVLESPMSEVEEVTALVKEVMESAYPLDPPLKVDIGVGANWMEVK